MSTLSLNSALAHGNETVYTTIYLFFIKKICIKNLKYDKWYTKYYYHLWAHDSQVYFSVPNLSSKLLTQIANCLPIIPSWIAQKHLHSTNLRPNLPFSNLVSSRCSYYNSASLKNLEAILKSPLVPFPVLNASLHHHCILLVLLPRFLSHRSHYHTLSADGTVPCLSFCSRFLTSQLESTWLPLVFSLQHNQRDSRNLLN